MCFQFCRSDPKISGSIKQSCPRRRKNKFLLRHNRKVFSFGKGWGEIYLAPPAGSLSSRDSCSAALSWNRSVNSNRNLTFIALLQALRTCSGKQHTFAVILNYCLLNGTRFNARYVCSMGSHVKSVGRLAKRCGRHWETARDNAAVTCSAAAQDTGAASSTWPQY